MSNAFADSFFEVETLIGGTVRSGGGRLNVLAEFLRKMSMTVYA